MDHKSSGDLALSTGDAVSSGVSGMLILSTGTSGSGNTGALYIGSGAASSGRGGAVYLLVVKVIVVEVEN